VGWSGTVDQGARGDAWQRNYCPTDIGAPDRGQCLSVPRRNAFVVFNALLLPVKPVVFKSIRLFP
jgi:hypothetical protein